jgi:hypothetical protein
MIRVKFKVKVPPSQVTHKTSRLLFTYRSAVSNKKGTKPAIYED